VSQSARNVLLSADLAGAQIFFMQPLISDKVQYYVAGSFRFMESSVTSKADEANISKVFISQSALARSLALTFCLHESTLL
jgi:hypothetical protein